MKNSRGEVAETRIKTSKEASMVNNIGIQRGDPEEDNNGVSIGTSMPDSEPPATPANERLAGVPPVTSGPGSAVSPVLPSSYSVGRGVSLPFDQFLPKCQSCNLSALIIWTCRSNPNGYGALCLDHGLQPNSATRDLAVWPSGSIVQHGFISPSHEAAIRAFLA